MGCVCTHRIKSKYPCGLPHSQKPSRTSDIGMGGLQQSTLLGGVTVLPISHCMKLEM